MNIEHTTKKPSIKRILESTPRLCIFILLIFTPLARGSVQGWAVTSIHIITLIAITAFLLDKTLYGGRNWIKTPLDKPILALLLLCAISSFFSVHKQTSFWAMVLLANYIVIYYLVIHMFHTQSQFMKLIYLITGIAVFLSLFGMLKLYGHNPFPWWNYPELNKDVPRLSATFGNANHLAGYMEMVILLLSGLILSSAKQIRRVAIITAIPLLLVSLILSISRGGWISLFIGYAFFFSAILLSPNYKKEAFIPPLIAGLVIITLVVLAYTPSIKRVGDLDQISTTPNLSARVAIWGGILKMIKDYPILGTGPGTFSIVFTQYQPPTTPVRYYYGHNDYLHFISETGIFIIPILLWGVFIVYKTGWEKFKSPAPVNKWLGLGAISGITAVLIHSLVDFNLHVPSNAILFTLLGAFTMPSFFKVMNT